MTGGALPALRRRALGRWPLAAGAAILCWGLAIVLILAALLSGTHAGTSAFGRFGVSPYGLADIPAAYLQIYRHTGARSGVDWALLAAIGKVETDHGRARLPGVRSGVNCAGAAGPMQMGVGAGDHGCGDAGNAWATYGRDGNGDGRRDVYDPADAIPAAAAYLRAAGAPGDVRRAVFAYNHADWYVAEVLTIAQRYRGALENAGQRTASRVAFGGRWLATLPGTGLRCDARIVADVERLISDYDLTATACFAATGHAVGGEHPLGLATDLVPADGDWDRTLAAARRFGWRPSCAASGCAGTVDAPMRVVLYNGYPGHGDPAHCPAPVCAAHLHLSWAHGPAAPLSPAPWVLTLNGGSR